MRENSRVSLLVAANEHKFPHPSRGLRKKKHSKPSRDTAELQAAISYARRNKILRKLGYLSYDEYLRSYTWSYIRGIVLQKNPTCEFCGNPATQVHHSRYTRGNLSGKSLKRLHSVCSSCHRLGEFTCAGQKLSPTDATRRMRAIRKLLAASR